MTTSGGSGGEMERLQTIEEAAESYSGGEGGPAMRGFIAGAEWAAAQTRWQVVDGDRVEQISCANCAAIRVTERAARHEIEEALVAFADEADPQWEDWSEKDWEYADPHWKVVRGAAAATRETHE